MLQPNILGWIAMFAPLAMVLFLSFRIQKMSFAAAQTHLLGLCGADGRVARPPSCSSIPAPAIAMTFFVTAATFGAMSLWGYTTSRDLTGMGSFLFMGLIGLILASLANMFFHSTQLQFVVSVLGVLIFTGLTAYDSQSIKNMYFVGDDGEADGQEGDHGRAAPLSRLHQPVPVPAAVHGKPALIRRQKEKARSFDRAFFFSVRQGPEQLLVEDFEHLGQFMAALEHQPAGRDHGILALACAQSGPFLHPEQRHFAGAAENREHRRLFQEIHGIIAPFPGRDHAAIHGQNAVELGAVEIASPAKRRNFPEEFRAPSWEGARNAMGSSTIRHMMGREPGLASLSVFVTAAPKWSRLNHAAGRFRDPNIPLSVGRAS